MNTCRMVSVPVAAATAACAASDDDNVGRAAQAADARYYGACGASPRMLFTPHATFRRAVAQ